MTTYAMPQPHPALGLLLTAAAAGGAAVELTAETLTVRLGLAWRCTVPRASVTSAAPDPLRTISVGAHGWRGDWLVNTSTRGLVVLTLDPPARGRCLGVPVTVRTLHLSLAEPEAFLAALNPA